MEMIFINTTNTISFNITWQNSFHALKPSTPSLKAGKILRASAPELIAEKQSDGVNTPGNESMPLSLVALITSLSVLGDTSSDSPNLKDCSPH